MPLKDPESRRSYHRQYMRDRLAADPDFKAKHLARVRRNDARARQQVADAISAFRSAGCRACGELDPACLEAHHLDPASKDFNLGNAARMKLSAGRVKAELAKCVCVCANCHRKHHAGRLALPPGGWSPG